MNIIKKIISKIKYFHNPPKPSLPFYTKDIFRDKKFEIGEYTYGNPKILFENEEANLVIGKFCSIAEDVTIFLGGNHKSEWITTYPFSAFKNDFPEASDILGHPATKGDVTIGNDVWIGRSTTILSGVIIGNGVIIAASAVVSKNIEDYEIWGGNPARLLKKRFDEEKIMKLKELKWWNWDIDEIKQKMHLLCSSDINSFKI